MRYLTMKSLTRVLALTSCMTLALPVFAQVDGDQEKQPDHAEFLSASGFALENCDVVAQPSELKEIIDRAAAKLSSNIIICVLPGVSNATLNLKYKGLRVIALQPGLTKLTGVTYVSAPTVLFGLSISSLALDKGSAGSVIAASTLGKSVSMTSDVILIGNKAVKGRIEGPLGWMAASLHLPDYARGLRLVRGTTPLSASQTGDNTVAGWLPRTSLSASSDDSTKNVQANALGQTGASKAKRTAALPRNPGNIASAATWFAQTQLVAHTSPNREGETLKRGQDVPVYRNSESASKPLTEMFFVPMHTGGHPDLNRIGVIFGIN
jgi:hypothetical protein